MWPQCMHIRKCTHCPPILRQSSQPSLDGDTFETVSRCLQVSAMARVSPTSSAPGNGGTDPGWESTARDGAHPATAAIGS